MTYFGRLLNRARGGLNMGRDQIWGGTKYGGSMVGADRLNVPAIDTFSH